jgi:hypothetical protein
MIIAYIKMYLRLGLGNLTILQLNRLQQEIDQMIQSRCDLLLLETQMEYDLVLADETVEREIEYYESCRSN